MHKGNRSVQKIAKGDNDRGFSLVEILVAITILAILTFPILSAFASAAKINQKARKQENCNSVGQMVTERCKSLSLDAILEDSLQYGFAKVIKPKNVFGESSGKLTEEEEKERDVYYLQTYAYDEQGTLYSSESKGDKYYVQVRLDPKAYMEKAETVTKADGSSVKSTETGNADDKYINSYMMPQFSDVLSDSHMVINKEIYEHDNQVKTSLGVSDLADIYRIADIYITVTDKTEDGVTLNTRTEKDGKIHSVYTQRVTLKVTYQSSVNPSQSCSYSSNIGTCEIDGDVNDSSYKDVYVLYNPYDVYRKDSGMEHSRDQVYFHVNELQENHTSNGLFNETTGMNGETIKNKKINTYLVEQKVNNVNQTSASVQLQKENVSVTVGNDPAIVGVNLAGKTLGIGSKQLVNLYSNVSELSQYQTEDLGNPQQQKDLAHQSNAITKSELERTEIMSLYDMTVEIYVNEEPGEGVKPYLTLTSTKEN